MQKKATIAAITQKLLTGVLIVGIVAGCSALFQSAFAYPPADSLTDVRGGGTSAPAVDNGEHQLPLEKMGIETGTIYEDILFRDTVGRVIDMPCWVWIPKGATTDMPLTVFLHGSEQTRSKQNLPMESKDPKSSLPLVIKDGVIALDAMHTILIAPHRLGDTYGHEEYITVIEAAMQYYGSDKSRIALTGFSWGGAMAYDLVAIRPDLFSVVFVACSGPWGNPDTVSVLAGIDGADLPPMITMITKSDRDFPYGDVLESLKPLGDTIEIITMAGGHYDAAYNAYSDPYVQALLFLTVEP